MTKKYLKFFKFLIATMYFFVFSVCGASDFIYAEKTATNVLPSYSPAVENDYPANLYWGDTHLHSNLSVDAYSYGNINLGPADAYRFARGEIVTAHNGMPAQLARPLDFLVIADHASNMGVMNRVEAGDTALLNTSVGQEWQGHIRAIRKLAETDIASADKKAAELSENSLLMPSLEAPPFFRQSVWEEVTALADQYNSPGQFTALIGFEWTQFFYNLHRVVIFQDGANKARQVLPFTQYDSSDPEDLWAYMAAYEQQTGGGMLAIPHNANLSGGVMFASQDAKGQPFSPSYAKTRSRWEPLLEVTQIKGDSETHPVVSPSDEFADFETQSRSMAINRYSAAVRTQQQYDDYDDWFNLHDSEKGDNWLRRYEYARPALKLGLQQQAALGVNPFKFGLIGSTDSHTALATADENNFWGKASKAEPHPRRITSHWISTLKGKVVKPGWRMNAAGYAAVWARENTRESLFAAMKRREVYASTGPRMRVRFFGGWDYQSDDAFQPNLAQIGYAKGVPMGGDLARAPEGKAPRFLIRAVRDPAGANLDRVQVIKGWHDQQGQLHEKIYQVALSDGRTVDRQGQVKPVGNTVNVAKASYLNAIGDPELAVVWEDPDFNRDELAFYYVRVLEIPTPKWTAYDAKFFKVKDIPDEVPMVTQERAYSSPIWYSP